MYILFKFLFKTRSQKIIKTKIDESEAINFGNPPYGENVNVYKSTLEKILNSSKLVLFILYLNVFYNF